MTVIQRAVAMAGGDVCALGNRTQDEATRQAHRLGQRMAQGQVRRNRRRQGAAGAMHVVAGNAGRCQTLWRRAGLQQHVHHLVASQVAAFEQHGFHAHLQQIVGRGIKRIGSYQDIVNQTA